MDGKWSGWEVGWSWMRYCMDEGWCGGKVLDGKWSGWEVGWPWIWMGDGVDGRSHSRSKLVFHTMVYECNIYLIPGSVYSQILLTQMTFLTRCCTHGGSVLLSFYIKQYVLGNRSANITSGSGDF